MASKLSSLNLSMLQFILGLLKEDECLKAKYDFGAHNLMIEGIKHYFGSYFFNRKLTILDLGCGKRFPHAFLFAMDGDYVIGVDKSYIAQQLSLKSYILSLKLNGLLGTARYIQLDLMRRRRKYYNVLMSLRQGGYSQATNPKFLQDDAEGLRKIEDQSID